MQRKTFFIIIWGLLFFPLIIHSQDVCFSQFYLNRLNLNPAFTGIDDHARLFLHYRNQWPDLRGSFVSYSATYDQPVKILHGGIGIILLNDIQGKGIINQISGGLIYSYKIKITRFSFARAGLQASLGQQNMNVGKIQLEDMFDPVSREFSNSTTDALYSRNTLYPDFAAGAIYHFWERYSNSVFYAGFSAHHLIEPTINGNTKLPRKYTGHIGINFPFLYNRFGFEEIRLYPVAMYQQQKNIETLGYGSSIIGDNYFLWVGMKHNLHFHLTTLVASIGIHNPNYSLAYSYDYLPSKKDLLLSVWGSHEITFLLNLQYKEKIKAIKCAKI